MKGVSIEEHAIELAQYIIDSKDTVRGTAKVTFQNGKNKSPIIPEGIEIKKVFLAEKNPIVRLGVLIK